MRTQSPFHIILKPVGAVCNLDCDYCFYLKKQNLYRSDNRYKPVMSIETVEKILIEYIISQPHEIKEVHIAWQGGEPTLRGLDFFKKIVKIQKDILPSGVTFQNSFQTNGILINDEWAHFFKENNFLVGLSLDGPEKFHNHYRKDKKGSESFSRVMDCLNLFNRIGVKYNTLICVNSFNADHGTEIYNFLKSSGSNYLHFIPIVEPLDSNNGKVTTRTVSSKGWGKFLIDIFDIWIKDDIGKVFVNHFDATLAGYLNIPGGQCMSSEICGNSLVVEHNGDIYSCDHFVDKDHLLGNINHQNMASMIESDFQKQFGKNKRNKLGDECTKCSYLRLCNGECPKNRIINNSLSPYKENWLCEGLKDFYFHTELVFSAMAKALNNGCPATDYNKFL